MSIPDWLIGLIKLAAVDWKPLVSPFKRKFDPRKFIAKIPERIAGIDVGRGKEMLAVGVPGGASMLMSRASLIQGLERFRKTEAFYSRALSLLRRAYRTALRKGDKKLANEIKEKITQLKSQYTQIRQNFKEWQQREIDEIAQAVVDWLDLQNVKTLSLPSSTVLKMQSQTTIRGNPPAMAQQLPMGKLVKAITRKARERGMQVRRVPEYGTSRHFAGGDTPTRGVYRYRGAALAEVPKEDGKKLVQIHSDINAAMNIAARGAKAKLSPEEVVPSAASPIKMRTYLKEEDYKALRADPLATVMAKYFYPNQPPETAAAGVYKMLMADPQRLEKVLRKEFGFKVRGKKPFSFLRYMLRKLRRKERRKGKKEVRIKEIVRPGAKSKADIAKGHGMGLVRQPGGKGQAGKYWDQAARMIGMQNLPF